MLAPRCPFGTPVISGHSYAGRTRSRCWARIPSSVPTPAAFGRFAMDDGCGLSCRRPPLGLGEPGQVRRRLPGALWRAPQPHAPQLSLPAQQPVQRPAVGRVMSQPEAISGKRGRAAPFRERPFRRAADQRFATPRQAGGSTARACSPSPAIAVRCSLRSAPVPAEQRAQPKSTDQLTKPCPTC